MAFYEFRNTQKGADTCVYAFLNIVFLLLLLSLSLLLLLRPIYRIETKLHFDIKRINKKAQAVCMVCMDVKKLKEKKFNGK